MEDAAEAFSRMGHRVEEWEGGLPDVSDAWARWMSLEVYAQVHEKYERIRPEMGRTLAAS
ncbi:MAG: hypothetical protein JRJ83_15440, partial [Deltaproteobacteria bacterium]|nr:hypothetical protein [Deltaproteobacteria bacterium]